MCHTIRGTTAGSRVGPDLTHLASRSTIAAGMLPNTIGNLGGWIMNRAIAQARQPHAAEPDFRARPAGPARLSGDSAMSLDPDRSQCELTEAEREQAAQLEHVWQRAHRLSRLVQGRASYHHRHALCRHRILLLPHRRTARGSDAAAARLPGIALPFGRQVQPVLHHARHAR